MRKPRVILIDDDRLILEMMKKWLSKRGYDVLSLNEPRICPVYGTKTKNCTEESLCADIMITDYQMPAFNGIELLQKQSQRGCPLSVRNKAVISGSAEAEVRTLIEKMGCAFFEKPLDLAEFSDWLSDCRKRIDLSLPLGEAELP